MPAPFVAIWIVWNAEVNGLGGIELAGRPDAVGEVRYEGPLSGRMHGHRRLLMHDLRKVITHVHLLLTAPL